MQDIISTLKNALQQAEAGLEVAVGRLAKDGTKRGEFQPSEVLALSCVREALTMPVTCLHQIQEPAAAEQAAWHAGLDEGRAQAALPVDDRDWREPTTNLQRLREAMTLLCRGNQPTDEMLTSWIDGTSDALQDFAATHGPSWAQGIGIIDAATLMADQPTEGPEHEFRVPQAAPAAVALPEAIPAAFLHYAPKKPELRRVDFLPTATKAERGSGWVTVALSPALAATPAAAPVVLPEPDAAISEVMALVLEYGKRMEFKGHERMKHFTLAETDYREIQSKLRALLATATGLPAQAGVNRYCGAGMCVSSDKQHDPKCTAAPQAQADARDDSALLDAMERQRIAVVPEYEGPWDAEVYNDEGKPNHRGTGSTPREAIRAAIAAAKEK